ncbi:MAG: molybdopterin-dependent oxidoreductase [Chloroflexi bacterium]|nr:molybdopterin-dependent oxidoreductase [Chloroflexota bacterium]MBU1747328.1 molybdopterin-dependent oxidoreductase [Chloroflexota bacterium]
MKLRMFGLVLLFGSLLVLGSQCPSMAAPTAAPTIAPTVAPTVEPTAPAPGTDVVLELEGLDGTTKSLTMTELQALPAYQGWGGSMSSTGRITPPLQIKGVTIEELAKLVGGLEPGTGVRVVAQDGYAMTFSYDQVAQGDYIVYDPGTGKETETKDRLRTVVSYLRDGKPNDPDKDGTLRIALLNDDQLQVTDGHWWVKWVHRIEIKSLAEDWTLDLEGARSETMDRASFESCAAPGCHGVTWKDDMAQTWTGVPLWLLAARVDDETEHGDGAYDRDLADTGYQVDIVVADGYTASVDGKQIKDNTDFIVAYLVNDNPLDDKDFPLRLVGPAAVKKLGVGQIARIVVHVAPVNP